MSAMETCDGKRFINNFEKEMNSELVTFTDDIVIPKRQTHL